MSGIKSTILAQLAGANVQRFHTRRTIQVNTVGHHSHGVAMLALLIMGWAGFDGDDTTVNRGRVLQACLVHDMGEWEVGDVPSPTKRAIPGLREKLQEVENDVLVRYGWSVGVMTPTEEMIVEVADCLDGMLFCYSEMTLGNRSGAATNDSSVAGIFNVYNGYVHELLAKIDLISPPLAAAVATILAEFTSIWTEGAAR